MLSPIGTVASASGIQLRRDACRGGDSIVFSSLSLKRFRHSAAGRLVHSPRRLCNGSAVVPGYFRCSGLCHLTPEAVRHFDSHSSDNACAAGARHPPLCDVQTRGLHVSGVVPKGWKSSLSFRLPVMAAVDMLRTPFAVPAERHMFENRHTNFQCIGLTLSCVQYQYRSVFYIFFSFHREAKKLALASLSPGSLELAVRSFRRMREAVSTARPPR